MRIGNKWVNNPTGINLFKVKYKNTRKRCKICSKLTMKAKEWRHNFTHCHGVSTVDFEQANDDWEVQC